MRERTAIGVWPGEPSRSSQPAAYKPLNVVKKEEERRERGERGGMELRPLVVKTGTVKEAAGSAYVEMGRTKVLVSVHGPRPDPRAAHFSNTGRLECSVKMAAFCGANDVEEHEKQLPTILSAALEAAVNLNRFPKSVVAICVLVLEMDGDATSAAITCASLALADACIEMFDLVGACAVVKKGEGQLVVDPEGGEMVGRAAALVAAMPSRGEVTLLSHHGEMSVEELQQAMSVGIEACRQVHGVARACLIASVGEEGGGGGIDLDW